MSFELANELNGAIRLLALRHRALTGARIGELGLHPGQDVILLALAHDSLAHDSLTDDSLTQRRLAAVAGCEPPSVTSMVRKLEGDGLVKRRQGSDARTRLVSLTPKGHAVIPRLREIWIEIAKETVSNLTRATPEEAFIAVRDLARSLDPTHRP